MNAKLRQARIQEENRMAPNQQEESQQEKVENSANRIV
jgi:hypothetical protein